MIGDLLYELYLRLSHMICDLPGTDLQQLNEEKEYTPIFYQEYSEIPTKEKILV